LTVSGCGSNDAVLVDLTTLAVTPLVAPGAEGLASPKDAAWSGNTLLLASPVSNAVLYFDPAGGPTGVRAQGISPVLGAGSALSPDQSRLAVASSIDDEVIEHDAATGVPLRTISGVCGGSLPSDVAYRSDGDLFVSCLGGNSVSWIDGASGTAQGSF